MVDRRRLLEFCVEGEKMVVLVAIVVMADGYNLQLPTIITTRRSMSWEQIRCSADAAAGQWKDWPQQSHRPHGIIVRLAQCHSIHEFMLVRWLALSLVLGIGCRMAMPLQCREFGRVGSQRCPTLTQKWHWYWLECLYVGVGVGQSTKEARISWDLLYWEWVWWSLSPVRSFTVDKGIYYVRN